MSVRMIPMESVYSKLPKTIRDLAKKLNKKVNFVHHGDSVEIDKMMVEGLTDPLVHIIRNSLDHGVEMPDERTKKGKAEIGALTITASQESGHIVISIEDDGAGINLDKVVEKAIENNVITQKESEHMSDEDKAMLIFAAGLSTAEAVSDVSGRAVGMDVVKRNISELHGSIEISSQKSKGTKITIRLPLTLAIIDGFLIQSGETKYIIPLEMIQECIELSASYKKQMHGNEFINLRVSMLPLLDIRTYFKENSSRSKRQNIVVVRYGDYKMGVMVDELFGEFQTVIKPLGEVFKNVPGISGGTILGSGEIALVFDIPKLIEHQIEEHR